MKLNKNAASNLYNSKNTYFSTNNNKIYITLDMDSFVNISIQNIKFLAALQK